MKTRALPQIMLLLLAISTACGPAPEPSPPSTVIVAGAESPDESTDVVSEWAAGSETTARFVLRRAHRLEAACATAQSFDGLRCAFAEPNVRSSPLARGTLLQPFESSDGRRLLLGGMWMSPEVQERVRASSDRFEVTCTLVMLGQASGVRVRSSSSSDWVDGDGRWVGRARACTVTRGLAFADEPEPQVAPPPPQGRVHFPLAKHSPRLGPQPAKVTIVEFADHQCPHCARLAPILKDVARANPKTVAIHFRHFPLSFHKRAHAAAVAVQAAQRQGQGWALSELIFANRRALTDVDILGYASQLNLKTGTFQAHLNDASVHGEVDLDNELAKQSGAVRGTPSVFINGEKYIGSRTESDFQLAIDAEVKRADALLRSGVPLADLYEKLCQ